MAIDTVNEKLALIEYGDVFQPGIPVSNDGIGQDDKQQLLWGYPGILWEVAFDYVLYNFIAKIKTFNFNAEPRPFNFNAKNRDFDFPASTGS